MFIKFEAASIEGMDSWSREMEAILGNGNGKWNVDASLPKARPKLKARADSLAQRLKEFRGLLNQYIGSQDTSTLSMSRALPSTPSSIPRGLPGPSRQQVGQCPSTPLTMPRVLQPPLIQAGQTPNTSLSMPSLQQPPLAQQVGQPSFFQVAAANEQVARLQQQGQLELDRQRVASQQLEQLAAAQWQAAAAERTAAEKIAAENRFQMQQLETAAMINQQQHQQRVLELETALLEQSALRERELQAQLRELDEQFEEVEAVDTRIKLRAAEVAELASSRAFEVERRLLVPSNMVWPPTMPTGTPTQPVISPSSSAPTFLPSASPVMGVAPSLPLTASSSGTQLLHGSRQPSLETLPQARPLNSLLPSEVPAPQLRTIESASSLRSGEMSHGTLVPAGLPRVYEAAVAIILQHGWQILHGGENAGPAWTALHWAASEGRLDVCEILLKAKADAGHRDELGKTALDYALENGQRGTASILTSLPEPEVSRSTNWSPSFNHEIDREGAQLVAALAGQGTWPRDEQRV